MAGSRTLALRLILSIAATVPFEAQSDTLKYGPLPYPVVNGDTWVLIEIWPTVGDITLSAYFLEGTSGKNRNLCAAAKRALDRDAQALAVKQGIKTTSFRQCMTIAQGVQAGYIETSN